VREEEVILILITMLILAGVSVLWLAMWNRRKLREMEHRERLAMIQHGLLPPPETDPYEFDLRAGIEPEPEPSGPSRWRTGGVFLVGLGLALMTLLTVAAGEPSVGIGIGGAFAVLGAVFLFNSLLPSSGRRSSWPPRVPPRRPDRARHAPQSQPPPNVGP
jgi:hypothetical protein